MPSDSRLQSIIIGKPNEELKTSHLESRAVRGNKCLDPDCLLSASFLHAYTVQSAAREGSHPHSGWVFPAQLAIMTTSHRRPSGPRELGISSAETLFPDDPWLCPVDRVNSTEGAGCACLACTTCMELDLGGSASQGDLSLPG